MDAETITVKKPKSAVLTKEERSALKDYRKKFLTAFACAGSIGISVQVLERVMLVGKASPDTIEKIKSTVTATK